MDERCIVEANQFVRPTEKIAHFPERIEFSLIFYRAKFRNIRWAIGCEFGAQHIQGPDNNRTSNRKHVRTLRDGSAD
jgi:hypothetical protein